MTMLSLNIKREFEEGFVSFLMLFLRLFGRTVAFLVVGFSLFIGSRALAPVIVEAAYFNLGIVVAEADIVALLFSGAIAGIVAFHKR